MKPDDAQVDDMRPSWTPDWCRFECPAGPAFFHVGREQGCDSHVVTFLARRAGIALRGESDGEGRIAPAVVERLPGDTYSPFFWMRH